MEYSDSECICHLVAYNSGLQIAHWLADTVTNEHRVLGELYDSMIELTDKFTEVYMGKYGLIEKPKGVEIPDVTDKPCKKGLELVQELYDKFTPEEETEDRNDDLLNILADMCIVLNRSRYLLKEKE